MPSININDLDLTKAKFRKSTRSNNGGNCVEVSDTYAGQDVILVRDSKDRDGAVLTFTRDEWAAFTGGTKDGEFDL